MSTKTMKEKATELLQRCEVVVLASVNKEGYPRPCLLYTSDAADE